MKESGKV